jgi:glycosyltransferase involved in cell wall biosynthesis
MSRAPVPSRGRHPPSARPPASICWEAPLLDRSGYASEAREFVLGLSALGLPIRALPVPWGTCRRVLDADARDRLRRLMRASGEAPSVHVHHHFPPQWRIRHRAARQIGRTTFETDRIPSAWVRMCNVMDEVWTTGRFTVETFAASGVRREKLVAIPEPIRMADYDPATPPLDVRDRRGFVFLSVFDWSARKGWDLLLHAFTAEFDRDHDDVILLLHVHSSYGAPAREIREIVDHFLRRRLGRSARQAPPIRVTTRALAPGDLRRLYAAADCFVLPTRGEGWGRPLMEAMAMRRPTIATRWSGQLEYMTDQNAYLCDVERLVRVPAHALREAPAFRGHCWAEPSIDDLRRLMRRVVQRPAEARARGERARAEVARACDVDVVCRRVLARLGVPAPEDGDAPRAE